MAGDVKKKKKKKRRHGGQQVQQRGEAASTHRGMEQQRSQQTSQVRRRKKKQQREQSVTAWLERSKSPQIMGVSNENTTRAQAFTLSREVIFKLFARYVPRSSPTCVTAAVSAVRNIHDVVLERPQSPQLPGGFKCSDTARAQTLDPYRERRVLLGVLLFQVACNTAIT